MANESHTAGSEGVAALGASTATARSSLVVMKFGGSSVSTTQSWATIASLIKGRLQDNLVPIVVLSALKGVTSALEQAISIALLRAPDEELAALYAAHSEIAAALELDVDDLLQGVFGEVGKLLGDLQGAKEASPQTRAEVIACGEALAAIIGGAYLRNVGIDLAEVDARTWLTAESHCRRTDVQNYLSASCDYEYNLELSRRIMAGNQVVLTQGYIARNRAGETVLLGREGSDTSAAYIAAKVGARCVEIWTDVPGIFTADPRLEPAARLLHELGYDEAQELASTGSRVLHPRCIEPLMANAIPLFIKCTSAPDIRGTVISAAVSESEPQVKGISIRKGVTLISMEGSSMWQEVGFLAAAFQAFSRHGVSVDLVSTSETSVVVSIDADDGLLSTAQLNALTIDLEELCQVRVIQNCAVVTLVGRRIRAILPRIAAALTIFEEARIHLVSQAANDLNFSFVIDEEQVPRILGKLHSSIIGSGLNSDVFGPAWDDSFNVRNCAAAKAEPWWLRKKDELLPLAEQQVCAYVYDAATVRSAARSLRNLGSVNRLLYAMKANFNPELIRILASEGVDFDCVSPAEVEHLRAIVPELDDRRILLTLNFAPRKEYEWAIDEGLQITLDNLYPLQAWPELFAGLELFIRIDPGQGFGHHDHVKTAGAQSKFGIPKFEVSELERLVRNAGATVVGIHAHSGSGILDPAAWKLVADELADIAGRFPETRVLDLGGGFGVPEKTGDPSFDLAALDELLGKFRSQHPAYDLWLEPGRYLVSEAGILLTTVTQTKGKGNQRYIGVGAGMNSLIRPALYGAYHEIVNLSRLDEPATLTATVVGPICETGDKLGTDRLLPDCREGDVMLVANAGAYGYVMGSRYNLREVAPEIVLPESRVGDDLGSQGS